MTHMNRKQRQRKRKFVYGPGMQKRILAVLGLLAVLSTAGCGRLHNGSGNEMTDASVMKGTDETNFPSGNPPSESASTEMPAENPMPDENLPATVAPETEPVTPETEPVTPETEPVVPEMDAVSERVEALLADMTLEEKIYQMFIITPEQLTGVSRVTAAGDATKASLKQYPVGGLVYFSGNLESIDQTKAMLSNVQRFANEIENVDLFLCVDEEGGRVARVAENEAFQLKNVAPMASVSSEEEAYRCGDTIGAYLSELGFNVDFAPDADVLTNGANTVIGDRSFGSDPDIVTKYAVACSDGLHAHGMMSTFKHFPGHGATEADTHDGYAYTDKSYEELAEAELRPFYAAKEHGVDMVMAAHISVPAVTGDDTPSSLSEQMITGILKGELGYNGLIVTDALNMGAVAAHYDSAEVSVKAVTAGVDLLLMPADFHAAYAGIYNAVQNGEISEERIDESVRKILTAKLK